GARAGLPQPVRAALDLLDELVAVLRLALQQGQHRRADVAAARAAAPARAAAAAGARPEEHRLELARVAPGAAAHHGDEVLEVAARTAVMMVMVVLAARAAPLLCMRRIHVVVLSTMCLD